MATIYISNLPTTGANLFSDSETYLNELTETEINTVKGGTSHLTNSPVITITPLTPDLITRITKML